MQTRHIYPCGCFLRLRRKRNYLETLSKLVCPKLTTVTDWEVKIWCFTLYSYLIVYFFINIVQLNIWLVYKMWCDFCSTPKKYGDGILRLQIEATKPVPFPHWVYKVAKHGKTSCIYYCHTCGSRVLYRKELILYVLQIKLILHELMICLRTGLN